MRIANDADHARNNASSTMSLHSGAEADHACTYLCLHISLDHMTVK